MTYIHPAPTPDDGSNTEAVPAPAPAATTEAPAAAATPAPVTDPAPVIDTPAGPAPASTPAPSSDQASTIAALQDQLAQVQKMLETSGVQSQAEEASKPPRALPKEGELVSYSFEPSPGRVLSRRGIVIGVDTENRKVLINWLPDAEAELPVDALDE